MPNTIPFRPVDQLELMSLAWSAVGKTAKVESEVTTLPETDSRPVRFTLTGDVDSHRFAYVVDGDLSIGPASQRATSATPDLVQLLASVLAQLEPLARQDILRFMPQQFEQNGGHIRCDDEELVAATRNMLQRLRAKKTIDVRGAVRFDYQCSDLAAIARAG